MRCTSSTAEPQPNFCTLLIKHCEPPTAAVLTNFKTPPTEEARFQPSARVPFLSGAALTADGIFQIFWNTSVTLILWVFPRSISSVLYARVKTDRSFPGVREDDVPCCWIFIREQCKCVFTIPAFSCCALTTKRSRAGTQVLTFSDAAVWNSLLFNLPRVTFKKHYIPIWCKKNLGGFGMRTDRRWGRIMSSLSDWNCINAKRLQINNT